jgi:dTDP-4-dehydrorhamnose 3,5-epimerase-like enzyme
MKVIQTGFPNLIVIEPDVFGDNRGWFFESYSYQKYSDLGINQIFVQDNHSFSSEKGTLRGLHFQTGDKAQSKLVTMCQRAFNGCMC